MVVCSYCGEEGHTIQQCPKWKGSKPTEWAEIRFVHSDIRSMLEKMKTEAKTKRRFRELLRMGWEVMVDIGRLYQALSVTGIEALGNNVAIALLSAQKNNWSDTETFLQKAIESLNSLMKVP